MERWAVTKIWAMLMHAMMKSHIELDVHIKHGVRYIAVRPKHVVYIYMKHYNSGKATGKQTSCCEATCNLLFACSTITPVAKLQVLYILVS